MAAATLATAALAAMAFTAGGTAAIRGRSRAAVQGRTLPATARRAEAFDPFGWKGKLKDTFGGLLDGLQEEAPSKLEEQMIIEIFTKFDLDKDRILNLQEFNTLQVVTEGQEAVYNQEQLTQLLFAVNPEIEEPEKGMPFADYRRLYVERRLREAYSTDVARDHIKIFGPGGGNAAAAAAAIESSEKAEQPELVEAPAEGEMTEAKTKNLPGTAVTVQGLQGAKELNGCEGHIVAPDESEVALIEEGRVIVQLKDGERVALKPGNILVAK